VLFSLDKTKGERILSFRDPLLDHLEDKSGRKKKEKKANPIAKKVSKRKRRKFSFRGRHGGPTINPLLGNGRDLQGDNYQSMSTAIDEKETSTRQGKKKTFH